MTMSTNRPFTPASFYQFLAEGQLMAAHCTHCGALHLPPRAVCSYCRSDLMEWAATSGRGRLVAFTAVSVPPSALAAEGFSRENPYCSAIVELEEGVKISARLLGVDARRPASIAIGTPVTAEFVRHQVGDTPATFLAFRA